MAKDFSSMEDSNRSSNPSIHDGAGDKLVIRKADGGLIGT